MFSQWLPSDWIVITFQSVLIEELWHFIEAAWPAIAVQASQYVYDSMPRRVTAVAENGSSGY